MTRASSAACSSVDAAERRPVMMRVVGDARRVQLGGVLMRHAGIALSRQVWLTILSPAGETAGHSGEGHMAMFPPGTERTRAGIAVLAVAAIALHLALQYAVPAAGVSNLGHLSSLPLWVALAAGGGPLVIEL